jgi:hypothetical protein
MAMFDFNGIKQPLLDKDVLYSTNDIFRDGILSKIQK